jgi:transketolase
MRQELCDALICEAKNPNMVFLTGDLGFMALETLKEVMQSRFINAGIAEQNMVSVAAAFAHENLEPWVYSIAPFCYARPFEQIRNDVAFHDLPVKIIGNGGGYGYGVMGPTHHAIEDYGILLTLPNMRVFVPAFNEDVAQVIKITSQLKHPSYLRLGRGEISKNYSPPTYAPWRKITEGNGGIVISIGPIAGSLIEKLESLPYNKRPQLWIVSELPLKHNPLPEELITALRQTKELTVIEEHVAHGGLGSSIALYLMEHSIHLDKFDHCYAKAHHYKTYGSQNFLRAQSGLDVKTLTERIS